MCTDFGFKVRQGQTQIAFKDSKSILLCRLPSKYTSKEHLNYVLVCLEHTYTADGDCYRLNLAWSNQPKTPMAPTFKIQASQTSQKHMWLPYQNIGQSLMPISM